MNEVNKTAPTSMKKNPDLTTDSWYRKHHWEYVWKYQSLSRRKCIFSPLWTKFLHRLYIFTSPSSRLAGNEILLLY